MLKTSRCLYLFSIVLLLLTLMACKHRSSGGQEGGTTSATVAIEFQTLSQAGKRSPFIGTINDITSITVDVMRGTTPLISGQQLAYSNGVWSGTLQNLPVGPALTFVGHAYNALAVEIFTGTTAQTMTGNNDAVTIVMAPVANGIPQAFPKITRITAPVEIYTSGTVTIGVSVEAISGETLTYAATAASGGGSFSPSSGTVMLSGTAGTLVLTYTAPATAGTYTHSIRVINTQMNWVETDFTTVVTGTSSPLVSAQFAPVITAIGAQRHGTDVAFTAEVSDAGPLSALTYSWDFDGGLSFVDSTLNPAVLQGYDETRSGNLTLTVSNSSGGSTTVSYYIAPGILPGDVVGVQGAQWARTVAVGSDYSVFSDVSVASDGSAYAAGHIVGTGTYDFGNNVTAAAESSSYGVWSPLLVRYDRAGVAQWARTVTAGSSNSSFAGVTVAADGSVYAAGYISGTGTYAFGNNVTAAGIYSGGNSIVLVKYDSNGAAQWARTVTAGNGYSMFYGVSVAADGSVYAAGYISGTGTYAFGNNVTAAGTCSYGQNMVVVKYDSAGVAQWARTVTAGVSYSQYMSVSVSSDGSVFAAGWIYSTSTYAFGNNVTVAGTSSTSFSIVLVKYNSSGDAQWARTVSAGSSSSSFAGVSVASDGSVYAVGNIQGTGTFDFGNGVTAAGTYSSANSVLVKYDSAGSAQWARTTTAGNDRSLFRSVSASDDGSVYAAGYIYGSGIYGFGGNAAVRGTSSGSNIVLVKYDNAGTAQWAGTVAAGSGDSGFESVFAAPDGAVYAAGYIHGTSTFDFGNNVTASSTYYGLKSVLVKYY